jgi:hypothetical protein
VSWSVRLPDGVCVGLSNDLRTTIRERRSEGDVPFLAARPQRSVAIAVTHR